MPNPFFSGRIPQELHQRIEEYVKSTGKTKTQALVEALSAYIGMPLSVDNTSITDGLEERLSGIEERLEALEGKAARGHQTVDRVTDGWLTTGEAYAEAQRRGYAKSLATFRRSLSTGAIPSELEGLGLMVNFDARQTANPKDNSVKWLSYIST